MSELVGASADPAVPPGSGAVSGGGGRGGATTTTSLRRATAWMATGTVLSRLTGVLRVLALAYALGLTHLADSYNLANTAPNMVYDVVLGGVLSATFIPVFVDRLATRSEREAWRAISSVVTVSLAVLVIACVGLWFVAPLVIGAFTALGHGHLLPATLTLERSVATSLLRWFVPQVFFYGVISLSTALLNTRRRFIAPMWVPIANNVVCIAVLVWFHEVTAHPSLVSVQLHPSQIVLLGLGTTLGVAVQAALLLPSLRRANLRLRWRWDPLHEAVRTVGRLGSWTLGFVLTNQIALFVVLALAVTAGGTAPVSSYTYAYTFMQMPYAVVAVSVMSAVTPDLAERWSTREIPAFKHRLAQGLRAILAIILPAAMGLLLLAKPAVALLLGHGAATPAQTADTGAALAAFALGLPGFCTFLYVVRVLQAMQRTKVAFWLYLVENAVNVVLAVAFVGPLGVRGLALALSIAYSVAAVLGLAVLRTWLGPLGTPRVWAPLRRVVIATVVMGVAVLFVSNVSAANHGLALLGRVLTSVVVGVVVFAATVALLGARDQRRRPRTGPPGAPGRAAGAPGNGS
ncbi:MAG TPA: murein biosynthesis integral membrane protein MurJ [Acidimicrobiales bacterium]|nr:murein biosynthesis integral membrane protein MurJ [Acidimicrobiales bacterium]